MKSRTPARNGKKRIFIVDDHPMTRHGLVQLINCERDLVICSEAGSAEQALARMEPPLPDLVVADITMPGKSGLEFIRDMQALHPEVPILVVSMHDESVFAERALRAGARGYIMKTEGGQKILEAIRRVLHGRMYVSEGLSATIIDTFARGRSSTAEGSFAQLTDREFEVFQLLGQGLSTRQISARLRISIPTVGTYRMHLRQKLVLRSGTELVQFAVRWAASQQAI